MLEHRSRSVTPRAVMAGLLGTFGLAALAPYNDYVLNNTFLIGNYLPVGVLGYAAILLVANGLSSRLRGRVLLMPGEFAVVLAVVLCACAVPTAGLMRWLPAGAVAFPYHASTGGAKADTFASISLSPWLFPTPSKVTDNPGADPVYADFVGRTPGVASGVIGVVGAVPWSAWLRPALAWGAFFVLFYIALLALVSMFHRQWTDNERLSFPLAEVYLSLVEPPAPGQTFNALFRSRGFLVAAGIVFGVHGVNGLSAYWPVSVPSIPLSFNLSGLLSEGIGQHSENLFKSSAIYFSVIGITYFLPTQIALSLWFFFVLRQFINMGAGATGADIASTYGDQVFGSAVMMLGIILCRARAELRTLLVAMVGRGGVGGWRSGATGWLLVISLTGMLVWLLWAGAGFGIALLIVIGMVGVSLLMARVVAETGLMYATVGVDLGRPMSLAAGLGSPASPSSFVMASWMNTLTIPGLRENAAVYASHGRRIASATQSPDRPASGKLMPVLFLAICVSFVVSGASLLVCEYNFAATADKSQQTPINGLALYLPEATLNSAASYAGGGAITDPGVPLTAMGVGALVTGLLTWLRAAFAWWPLHPVGYLLWQSLPIAFVWWSLMLGWLAKSLILRFGGSKLYHSAKPIALGLILGETGAALFWMLVSIALSIFGAEHIPVRLLPGG